MKKFTVCFDVDGTLIRFDDTPRYDVLDLLRVLHDLGATIYVWSGGGEQYATHWVAKLGLTRLVTSVISKGSITPDLAIDDESECTLGKTQLWVGEGLKYFSVDHS